MSIGIAPLPLHTPMFLLGVPSNLKGLNKILTRNQLY
jgi:hypothetical protein